jgi:hypothetical protein
MEKSSMNKEPEVFCRALRITSNRGIEDFILSGPARKEVTLFTATFSKEHNGWLAVAEVAKIPRGPSDPINWPTRSAIRLLKLQREVKFHEWVNT